MSRIKDGDPIDIQPKVIPGAVFEFPEPLPGSSFFAADSVTFSALQELRASLPETKRESRYYPYAYYRNLGHRIKDKIEKKHFFGRLGRERIVVIEPQPSYLSESFRVLDPEQVRSFIGTVDLISTGRGTIGSYVYGVSVGLRGLNKYGELDYGVSLREMSGRAIKDLISDSQENWARVLSDGLRTPYRGGIPGLGKR